MFIAITVVFVWAFSIIVDVLWIRLEYPKETHRCTGRTCTEPAQGSNLRSDWTFGSVFLAHFAIQATKIVIKSTETKTLINHVISETNGFAFLELDNQRYYHSVLNTKKKKVASL